MLYVLDASALINNPFFSFSKRNKYACTLEVLEELRSFEVKALAENALKMNLLRVYKPKHKYKKGAEKLAKKYGFERLSKADLSIIALALQLKKERKRFVVITDDYSIQNFLAMRKINYWAPVQGTIKEVISFEKFCPVCMKIFNKTPKKNECPDCGVKLKSRRVKVKAQRYENMFY
ncbi:MAG: PIN domain-containing protein [Candidatus Diapherotrites archaeon]